MCRQVIIIQVVLRIESGEMISKFKNEHRLEHCRGIVKQIISNVKHMKDINILLPENISI